MVAGVAHALFQRTLKTFYRAEARGQERIPEGGPVLFVANHPNGVIDPLLVSIATPRRIRFLAKSTLFTMPGMGWCLRAVGGIPVYRQQDAASAEHMKKNDEMFAAAAGELAAGGTLCIFPEGTSHSDPQMRKMKTGAARMAFLAEAGAGWKLGVKIVPVGLYYEKKHRFRSRALVEVGHAVDVAAFHEAHDRDPVEAARQLTDNVRLALGAVVVQSESDDDLALVKAAERVMAADAGVDFAKAELDGRWPRLKRIAEELPLARLRAPGQVARVSARLKAHAERLEALGVTDDRLVERYRAGGVVRYVARTLAAIAFVLPFALVGAAAFYLPYEIPRWLSRAVDVEEDKIASVKAGAGLVLVPAAWLAWSAAAWRAFGWRGLAAALVGLPIAGLAAIALRDRQREIVDDAAAFLRLGGRGRLRRLLIARRTELAREIAALAAPDDPEANDRAQLG